MSTTDRSYAVRMKQLAGGINAQFRANNPTAPQENSQPGAVEQSYRTGRIFGQIPVNVDGDISPACGCVPVSEESGGSVITIDFDDCKEDYVIYTLTAGNTLVINNNLSVGNIAYLLGTTATSIPKSMSSDSITTPGTYTIGCYREVKNNGQFTDITTNTSYIFNNIDTSNHTVTFDGTGGSSPTLILAGQAVSLTSGSVASYTVS
jgi:hypothetical protein